jgi:N-acetylmuramoyl-L-alanine amidase
MMQRMTLAYCGASICRVFFCLIFSMLFLFQAFPARQWDVEGASRAYKEACEKQTAIAHASQPGLSQYLECAKTYRKVYFLDPHYRHAGDALYSEGLLYQQMGDTFSDSMHYKIAVKRLQLLVTDYATNPNCPDALLRLAAIYSSHLDNETAAQDAYRQLRTEYKAAYKSFRQAHPEIDGADAVKGPEESAPSKAGIAGPASVQNLRYWSTSDYTRIIIDLDSVAAYKWASLSNPDRMYIDISDATLSKNLINMALEVGDDYLKQVRTAYNKSHVVRVVLDVSDGIDYSISELNNPFRIVVDLRGTGSRTTLAPIPKTSGPRPDEISLTFNHKENPSRQEIQTTSRLSDVTDKLQEPPKAITGISPSEEKQREAAESNVNPTAKVPLPSMTKAPPILPMKGAEITTIPQAAPPTSHGDRTLTRMLGLKIGRIVIDPGHGGHDQGTVGPGGLLEKDLVLSLARILGTMLEEELGAEVLLTRDEDVFISLEERTAFANRHHADLFISIHANSSRIRSLSGVETYYLDFAKTNAEREIAARENATSNKNVSDLEDLISKIAKADKSAESRELASLIQNKLYSSARNLFPSTRNRGVRSAPFIVLIDANMPSVLVEVAFISNSRDEKLLGKMANRETLAKALFEGIEGYVSALGIEMARNQANKLK